MKQIYIAMIMHDYGATGFASTTPEGRLKKIADWCRENWQNPTLPDELTSTLDQDIVACYFEDQQDEICFLDEDEI
mgnify:CR=1 FL=1